MPIPLDSLKYSYPPHAKERKHVLLKTSTKVGHIRRMSIRRDTISNRHMTKEM